MSQFKGTKGKWEVMARSESRFSIIGDQIDVWAFNEDGDIPYEEAKANAQLISKAPELLEELKIAVKALKAVNSLGATKPIIERWEKLIKEATTI